MEVRELSVGDYVLNGGEVAALAMIEAVVRLLPGFMGNAESLDEESHADGLLEYPVYTKPATWRGHEVPEVLLSGDHARIAAWRHDQSVRRTAERRPDLAHASRAVELGALAAEIALAAPADAAELFTLQRACWVQEQQANPDDPHPAAARGPRRRRGVARGVDDARAAQRRPAGRCRPRPPGRRGVGHRPADGRARPAGARARAGAARGHRGGCPGRGDRLRAVHRCAAASATSGSTRRPATGCSVRPRRPRAPYAWSSAAASPSRRFRRTADRCGKIAPWPSSRGHLPQGDDRSAPMLRATPTYTTIRG